MNKTQFIYACGVCLLLNVLGFCETSHNDSLLVFLEANRAFSQANEAMDSDQVDKLYEQSILGYEKIIEEGGIKNAKLYYNLANAYLLNDDIGRAILNYRRAQELDSSNPDIYKNLNFARRRRIDQITVAPPKKVMERLLFWHYDFTEKTRFVLGGIFFAIFPSNIFSV